MSAGGYSGYKLEYSDWSPVRFTRGLAAAREERLLCGPEMFVCVCESVGVCVCVALLRKLTKLCSVANCLLFPRVRGGVPVRDLNDVCLPICIIRRDGGSSVACQGNIRYHYKVTHVKMTR
jgi:hypothetical protein